MRPGPVRYILLLSILLITGSLSAQKTLVIEKVGTSRMHFYHTGDPMKLRVSKTDTLLKGRLWAIFDSAISISELRPFDVKLQDINAVYKKYAFPAKFAKYTAIAGGVFFGIIAVNHLINNEKVFSNDIFIIPGTLLGASLISFSFSEKKCNTTKRWRIKILDADLRK